MHIVRFDGLDSAKAVIAVMARLDVLPVLAAPWLGLPALWRIAHGALALLEIFYSALCSRFGRAWGNNVLFDMLSRMLRAKFYGGDALCVLFVTPLHHWCEPGA